MALIYCVECGKQFSDKAPACPNCGCPTSAMATTPKRTFDEAFETTAAVRTLNPGAIKKAKATIDANEHVEYAAYLTTAVAPSNQVLDAKFSVKGKVGGVFAITERRVLFVTSSLGIGAQKEIAIKDITSIDSKKSLTNCPVRIKGLTEMFVIDCNSVTQKKILSALSAVQK